MCPQGKYSFEVPSIDSPNETVCKICPPQAEKCELNQMTLLDGFWRESNISDLIYLCSKSSINCIASSLQSRDQCREGSIGPLCSSCDVYGNLWETPYVKFIGHQCQKCSEIMSEIFITLSTHLAIVIYVFFLVWQNYTSIQRKILALSIIKLGILRMGKSAIFDQFTTLSKIFMNYWLLIFLLSEVNIQIPEGIQVLQVGGDPALSFQNQLDCTFSEMKQFYIVYWRVIWIFFFSILLTFSINLIFISIYLLAKWKMRDSSFEKKCAQKNSSEPANLMIEQRCVSEVQNKLNSEPQNNIITTMENEKTEAQNTSNEKEKEIVITLENQGTEELSQNYFNQIQEKKNIFSINLPDGDIPIDDEDNYIQKQNQQLEVEVPERNGLQMNKKTSIEMFYDNNQQYQEFERKSFQLSQGTEQKVIVEEQIKCKSKEKQDSQKSKSFGQSGSTQCSYSEKQKKKESKNPFHLKLYLKWYSGYFWMSLKLLFFYIQPGLVKMLFSVLNCEKIGSKYYIFADLQFQCDQQYKVISIFFVIPALLVLCIVIPLFLFYQLKKNKNNQHQFSFFKLYGIFFQEYKNTAYYWEILRMSIKTLISCVLIFFSSSTILKLILAILIIAFYLFLQIKVQPYRVQSFNKLDYLSNAVVIMSLILGLLITSTTTFWLKVTAGTLIGFINVLFILKMIKEYLLAIKIPFESENRKIHHKFLFFLGQKIPICKSAISIQKAQIFKIFSLWKKISKLISVRNEELIFNSSLKYGEFITSSNIKKLQSNDNLILNKLQKNTLSQRISLINNSNILQEVSEPESNKNEYISEQIRQNRQKQKILIEKIQQNK